MARGGTDRGQAAWLRWVVSGRAVAVQGAALGAGDGGAAVGIQYQPPAPAVDHDQMMEPAQQDQIGQGGWSSAGSGNDVVHLAHAHWLVAPGKGAGPDGGWSPRGAGGREWSRWRRRCPAGGWLR